ncbi:Auxin-induced protein AUX28 [Populus alba x Populus x berolinensis]|nr:Auxin-induced protein AUX28 [Populus alba x Populus x berolinensis]
MMVTTQHRKMLFRVTRECSLMPWMSFQRASFLSNSEVNAMLSPRPSPNMGLKPGMLENLGVQQAKVKEIVAPKAGQERPHAANETRPLRNSSANNSRHKFVGWPPIKSFRKNSLATTSKNTEEVDGKAGPGALFIKVSMDGAPYLRKVDLRNYSAYQELSSALEKMFSCFTIRG